MLPSIPKVEVSADVRVLTFIDRDGHDIEEAITRDPTTGAGPVSGHLLLDFTNVERVSSEGLGALVGLHKRMRLGGGRLTLFNLCPQLYEVFEITRLDTLLRICREE
jgi:anti-anti-sigma factor